MTWKGFFNFAWCAFKISFTVYSTNIWHSQSGFKIFGSISKTHPNESHLFVFENKQVLWKNFKFTKQKKSKVKDFKVISYQNLSEKDLFDLLQLRS